MVSKTQIFLGKIALRLLPSLYLRSQLKKSNTTSSQNFFLTFDCDTDRDAEAAINIQSRLNKVGMRAGYAIPGELLRNHWDEYQQLLSMGGYFINHGYRKHAEVDLSSGRVYSTFTYRDVDDAVWQQDILDGHHTILQLTGKSPSIFRTPHFGEFNSPTQLQKLYIFLAKLEYKASSSTTPIFGFLNGPIYKEKNGITELPLSGSLRKPTQLIDSWGFIAAPDALGREQLVAELGDYLSKFASGKKPMTNIYFDPADIAQDEELLDLLTNFAPYSHPGYDKYLDAKMS